LPQGDVEWIFATAVLGFTPARTDYRHGDLPPVAATAVAINSRVLDEIFIGWLAESYAAAGCLHHG
jgi:hypothetical protein